MSLRLITATAPKVVSGVDKVALCGKGKDKRCLVSFKRSLGFLDLSRNHFAVDVKDRDGQMIKVWVKKEDLKALLFSKKQTLESFQSLCQLLPEDVKDRWVQKYAVRVAQILSPEDAKNLKADQISRVVLWYLKKQGTAQEWMSFGKNHWIFPVDLMGAVLKKMKDDHKKGIYRPINLNTLILTKKEASIGQASAITSCELAPEKPFDLRDFDGQLEFLPPEVARIKLAGDQELLQAKDSDVPAIESRIQKQMADAMNTPAAQMWSMGVLLYKLDMHNACLRFQYDDGSPVEPPILPWQIDDAELEKLVEQCNQLREEPLSGAEIVHLRQRVVLERLAIHDGDGITSNAQQFLKRGERTYLNGMLQADPCKRISAKAALNGVVRAGQCRE